MAATNSRDTRKHLQQRFRNKNRDGAGMLIAYEDANGANRDIQGDAEAPWVKNPPFTEDPQKWLAPTLLPSVAVASTPYITLQPINVKQYRALAVYLTYLIPEAAGPPAGIGQLSLVPEMLAIDPNLGQAQWYTMSLVDLAFSVVSGALNPPFDNLVFASSNFFPQELRWPDTAVGPVTADLTLRTRLFFDVTNAEAFRLSAIELNASSPNENTLSVAYSRSQ